MSDLDLDELRGGTCRVRRSRRRRADARRARSASSPASRRSSGLSRSTAAPRSTAKTATSSSGCMPCASTACARLRNAAPCLRRSIIRACLLAQPSVAAPAEADRRWTNCWPNWRARRGADDITDLRHVRTSADKRAAEEIANRKKCEDFETFKPLFERVQAELKTRPAPDPSPSRRAGRAIEAGDFFIVDGSTPTSPRWASRLKTTAGEVDRRLRVIFDNGTESNLLLRSLQRAFYNDAAARRLVSPESGPLSSAASWKRTTSTSGTIYVLRSKSDHPVVAQHRDLIHKIGVTGGKVETRIANAEHDATYLLAKVEVVATYELSTSTARGWRTCFTGCLRRRGSNITINDRFGHPVQPQEWFLVPLVRR